MAGGEALRRRADSSSTDSTPYGGTRDSPSMSRRSFQLHSGTAASGTIAGTNRSQDSTSVRRQQPPFQSHVTRSHHAPWSSQQRPFEIPDSISRHEAMRSQQLTHQLHVDIPSSVDGGRRVPLSMFHIYQPRSDTTNLGTLAGTGGFQDSMSMLPQQQPSQSHDYIPRIANLSTLPETGRSQDSMSQHEATLPQQRPSQSHDYIPSVANLSTLPQQQPSQLQASISHREATSFNNDLPLLPASTSIGGVKNSQRPSKVHASTTK